MPLFAPALDPLRRYVVNRWRLKVKGLEEEVGRLKELAHSFRETNIQVEVENERLRAVEAECEADHPPEPEYVAWCAAGKPDGVEVERLRVEVDAVRAESMKEHREALSRAHDKIEADYREENERLRAEREDILKSFRKKVEECAVTLKENERLKVSLNRLQKESDKAMSKCIDRARVAEEENERLRERIKAALGE